MDAVEYAIVVSLANANLIWDMDDAISQSEATRKEVQSIQDKYAYLHHLGAFLIKGKKS